MSQPLDPRPPGPSALAVPSAAPPRPMAVMAFATDGPHPTDTADDGGPPWFLDFRGVLRRHPLVFLLTFALSGWLGYHVGARYHTKLWPVEGRLRFVKPAPGDPGRSPYESMSLPTYADLLGSEELLRPVADAFADRLPPADAARFLKRELRVEAPRNFDVIEIKWDAADPQLAADVINRLMGDAITYTDKLRRNTILRHAAEQLQHRIIDCDAQARRITKAVDEYKARVTPDTPIDTLDAVELDAHHSQRRRTIHDQIAVEKNRVQDKRVSEATLASIIKLKEEHVRQRIIPELEVVDTRRQLHEIRETIKIVQAEIRRLEDRYREVPIEFANAKLLELKIKMTEAEVDFKLLQRKSHEALARGVPLSAIDPGDEEWAKLRRRLVGPDTPEFEVMQSAAVPAQPSNSNRKMLTVATAAAPAALVFLGLAFVDHRRSRRRVVSVVTNYGPPARSGYPPVHDESALLSVRIQQWIVGEPVDGVVIETKSKTV